MLAAPLSLSLRSRRRIEMDFCRQGVPEIFLLGRYNLHRAEIPLKEHQHRDIIEICYLVKGRQTYRVAGQDYHLKGGDVFVSFPGELHSTAGRPEEKGVLYWLMLRRTEHPFFGLATQQSNTLWKTLCRLPQRHFRGSRSVHQRLDALTSLYHQTSFPLRPTYLASEALALVLELLRCAESPKEPRHHARSLQAVLNELPNSMEETLTVPQLAAMAGLSTPRFKARFKEEMGVPPGEYMLRLKIAEATKRLANQRASVTEIAHALGFSSSQYFATVFKRFTGQTPTLAMARRPTDTMRR